MSDFFAEAEVLIRPNARAFREELAAQLAAIKVSPVVVPVVAAGAGLAGVAAATAALSGVQAEAVGTTKALDTATRIANTSWARQATILPVVTGEMQALAGAQAVTAASSRATAASLLGVGSASGKLDAALLGLRTALGSTAVIGLGAAALAAIAAGKAIRGSIAAFVQFQTELLTFRATTGATADEMLRVSAVAKQLGADVTLPAVSAGDAAVAMTELARAGLSVEEAIQGARGVLQLATAAQIDNAAASELAASALNAFGLGGDQAVRVADDLANAANAAQGSIADMGIALQQSAAVARQVGINLEDTVSILTLLARNGLRGSDAGTSLRTALIRLIAPTKEATGLIRTLGIAVRDAQGNIRPDVFAQFAEATAALSPAMRDAIAATVFGQDAIRAVAIAGREGADGLRLMRFQIDQQGTAAELAAARTEGLGGAMEGLSSSAQTLGIGLGKLSGGVLTNFVRGLTAITQGANAAVDALERLGEVDIPDVKVGPIQVETPDLGDATKEVFLWASGWKELGLLVDAAQGPLSEADKNVQTLTEDIDQLQRTRLALAQAKLFDLADLITPQIQELRRRLQEARIEAGDILPPATDLQKAVAPLNRAIEEATAGRERAIKLGLDTAPFDAAIRQAQEEIAKFVFDTENQMNRVNKLSFRDLATNLQTALRGFKLDPTGDLAAGFLRDARRIARQLANLAPDVSASARRAFVEPLRSAIQAAIDAAVAEGDTGTAAKLEKWGENLMKSAAKGIKKGADLFVVPATQEAIDAALAPSGLAIAQAQAAGSDNALLAALRARKAAIQRQLEAGGLSIDQETQLNLELASINSQIQGIFDQRAADQREATSNIQRAKDEADQAFLDALNLGESRFQNRIAAAASDEALGNDIAANKAFKRFILNQIRLARERIKDSELLATTLASLNAALIRVNQTIRNLRRQQREESERARKQAISDAQASVELDVQIAETTGNKAALRRALQAEIEFFKERIRATRAGTLQRKRWLLALRQAQKELRELTEEKKKEKDAFKALTFEFLTTQQGFAANLFGNLIPTTFTGLVTPGGSVTQRPKPAASAATQAALVREAKITGPTQGQAATEIDVLRQMLRELQAIRAGRAFPEATFQKHQTAGTMETQ